MRSSLLLALVLGHVVFAQSPLTVPALVESYEQRLAAAPAATEVDGPMAELERLRASALPRLRLSERLNWDSGELVDLGLNASLNWVIEDPEARLRRSLASQRLNLARHNESAGRDSQMLEFRRTLRLLTHLSKVEALLARHRVQLLALKPEWRELEGPGAEAGQGGTVPTAGAGVPGSLSGSTERAALSPGGSPVVDRGDLDYLQLVQALDRTRRERSLLLLLVAERTGIDPAELASVEFERRAPSPLTADPAACLAPERFRTAETVRARLLLEESRITEQLEKARAYPRVSLDLSGNARYANPEFSRNPWSGAVRLALNVALPASQGVSSEMSLAATPSGFSQELSVAWPADSSRNGEGTDEAERSYELAIQRARLNALGNLKALYDARDRLLLRRAELTVARNGTGGDFGLDHLNATAEAELALLNAELEVDLAALQVAAICTFEE